MEQDAVDPVIYGLGALTLLGTVLMASYLPARKAVGIDPVEALRAE